MTEFLIGQKLKADGGDERTMTPAMSWKPPGSLHRKRSAKHAPDTFLELADDRRWLATKRKQALYEGIRPRLLVSKRPIFVGRIENDGKDPQGMQEFTNLLTGTSIHGYLPGA
jgi:hypothetical protein